MNSIRHISLFILLVFTPLFCIAQETEDVPISRKCTLKIENKTLQEALNTLEDLGDFTFAYSENSINLERLISVNETQKTILQILQKLFPNKGYAFKSVGNQILIYKEITDEYYVLSGYVREKESQESLPEASVYIPEIQQGVITNNYGFFSIELEKATYNILTSYIGYGDDSRVINLNKNQVVTIELALGTESLDEVTILGSTYQKPSKSSQMSSLKLTNKQIETTPVLLGERDILKTLQLLPGIQSGAEGSAQVLIRGGSPDQNLTILDEVTVYNSNHLFGFISVYNVDAVKSTKIYKGAFPSKYGGRLSGVMDLTMKDGNKETISGAFNIGILSSSFLLEGPIQKDKTSFLLSGRRSFADLIARSFQAKNDNQADLFFYDMNAKLHHIINERNTIYLSSYFGKDSFATSSEKQTSNTEERLSWGNLTTTARWNHQYGNKLFSNLSLIYSNYNLKAGYKESINTIEERQSEFEAFSGINDYGVKLSFDYHPNTNHDITFGLQSTAHHFIPERKKLSLQSGAVSKNEQRLNSLESSIYFEDVISLSRKLTATTGLRLNYFNTNRFNNLPLEPRLSLAYRLKSNLTVKASYTKMNQFVHLLSNTGTGLPTDLWVSSTKNVAPQQAEQFALGIAKGFNNIGYSLEVEGYYKTLKNVITYKEGASFLDIQNLQTGQNVSWEDNITSGNGWAYGAEFLLRKQIGKIQGLLGYTLSWSQRQFYELNQGRMFFSKYDQRHNINLVSTYKLSNKITWSASWTYRSGTNFTLPNLESLNADNGFPIGSGTPDFDATPTSQFTTRRNNVRGEATHRLNLGVQFHKKTKRDNLRTWDISVYNVYARRNPLYYYVSDGNSSPIGIGGSSEFIGESLRRVSVLVFIPSISYSYKF
ncbi:TonB-dependent receptor [uncultured Algibacter sp.]|uniref:TonB-dependent receptor n=1 Tax=uncultured Algibacter sp. TaxID=298659 RepID=UPI00321737F6